MTVDEQFVSEEVEVTRNEQTGRLVSFRWNSEEYAVREIVAVWPDWGFSAGAPERKNWRMRRHRTWYRVETATGGVFDLYHDRGTKLEGGRWVLHSRLK